MKVGRLKNRIKRQKAEKRQKKIREEQEKRSAKRAKKEADKQALRDKFKDRLKKNLSGVAEDRQIRLLQRNETRRLRRQKSPTRKLNIEPGDETKTDEVTMGTFENSAEKIREARAGRMAEFARKSAPFVNAPLSYAELREELGEKTGIWSKDTIVGSNKKTFSLNNFKIDTDQLAYNAGENAPFKPVYDDTAPVRRDAR